MSRCCCGSIASFWAGEIGGWNQRCGKWSLASERSFPAKLRFTMRPKTYTDRMPNKSSIWFSRQSDKEIPFFADKTVIGHYDPLPGESPPQAVRPHQKEGSMSHVPVSPCELHSPKFPIGHDRLNCALSLRLTKLNLKKQTHRSA